MRRLFLSVLLLLSLVGTSWGAALFSTTIRETSIQQVQDMILEVMTGGRTLPWTRWIHTRSS